MALSLAPRLRQPDRHCDSPALLFPLQYEEAVSSLILVKKELAKTRLALHRSGSAGAAAMAAFKPASAPASGRASFDGGKQHLSDPSIADFGRFQAVERIRLTHVSTARRCAGWTRAAGPSSLYGILRLFCLCVWCV